jgi:hypothetical protein
MMKLLLSAGLSTWTKLCDYPLVIQYQIGSSAPRKNQDLQLKMTNSEILENASSAEGLSLPSLLLPD